MCPEFPVLTTIDKLYGPEIGKRAGIALRSIPWSFSIRNETGIIHEYNYPFAGALRNNALEILERTNGIQRLEKICQKTISISRRGMKKVEDTALAFDQHIGTGMSNETEKRSIDCYQRSSLEKAERYLRKIGIIISTPL
jgi:hypothetical protein